MNQDLLYNIALTQLQGVGIRTAHALIDNLGSAEAVFKENPDTLRSIGSVGSFLADEAYRQKALAHAQAELSFIEKNNIKPIFFKDEDYPYRLAECPDAPVMLYQIGGCNLNAKKFVSVIGTRNATKYGRDLTDDLIKTLAASNPDIVIVSGLAYGIDIAAHRSALEHGLPTIGVVAHGLDQIYPSAHRQYASQMILNGGAILTEYCSGIFPDAGNFVQRNRIVAGMCDVAVVVESAIKGGALITANLANDYNRDVMAYPGRIGDKSSAGCNRLIREHKAEMITSAEDLIGLMGWSKSDRAVQQNLFNDLTPEQQMIIDLLKIGEQHINTISSNISLSIQKTSALLTEMVFNDLVEQLPGDIYTVK